MSKQITITKLELHNFKGARNVVVPFNPLAPTTISGRNGTGKTTIMDAFTWLLWGLNSEDQQTDKFGIKPNTPDGKPMLDLDTEVEGSLSITDDETGETTNVTLKRRWVAVWRTRSGETEREFVRNKGEYFINDVPVKQADYNAKVADIIPQEIFRCITNPFYFPELPWKEKREVLLKMTDDVTYDDVAHNNAEFAEFINCINGKSVEDYNAELNARVARINKELEMIPVRVQEAQRGTPIAPDYAQLEAEKVEQESIITEVDSALATASEQNKALEEARATNYGKQREISEKMHEVLSAAQEAAWHTARIINAKAEQVCRDRDTEMAQWSKLQADFANKSAIAVANQATAKARAAYLKEQQDTLRDKWYAENKKTYTPGGALICPITSQPCTDQQACTLHANNETAALEAFNAAQTKVTNEITARGQQLTDEIAAANEIAAKCEAELKALETLRDGERQKHEARLAAIQQIIDGTPKVEAATIKGEELPEWVALNARMTTLKAQLDELRSPISGIDTLGVKKQAANQRLAEINRKLGLRMVIEQQEQRVAELQASEKTLLQERANIQRSQKVIERMTRARMDELEARVNAMFKTVRFQMFEPTATTGDEKPNCVCWVGGNKFADTNHAGQVHAGLDIIATLCAYHHISAPIFIDYAESVNDFPAMESQLVLLKVTTDDFKIQ